MPYKNYKCSGKTNSSIKMQLMQRFGQSWTYDSSFPLLLINIPIPLGSILPEVCPQQNTKMVLPNTGYFGAVWKQMWVFVYLLRMYHELSLPCVEGFWLSVAVMLLILGSYKSANSSVSCLLRQCIVVNIIESSTQEKLKDSTAFGVGQVFVNQTTHTAR